MRVFFLVLGLGIMALAYPQLTAVAAGSSETYRQLNLFGDVFDRVREDYVDEVEDPELIEAAVNGMLQSLDPHSSFLNADRFKDMQVQTRGEFGGLGIEVTMENGLVKVVSPIDDTPAERAGLQAGDFITHLDGEPVLGLTLSEAVDKMRGAPESSLTITVLREGKEPFEVSIIRDIISIKSVRWRAEGDIGYLRVTSFTEKTMPGVAEALDELSEEIGKNKIKGLVLDLRNNPGGLLDQAIAVSDAFLDQGEIVSTRGRRADDIQRYNAKRGDLVRDLPMIVLVNQGSASASEIVAGALQDHRRAIVLGARSFGKGSVQTIIPLGTEGAMRLTTARYYTPSGKSIQARGIIPDIEVSQVPAIDDNDDLTEAEKAAAKTLSRRSEADLRNHLDVGTESEGGLDEDVVTAPTDGVIYPPKLDEGEEAIKDFQLTYALDLLNNLAPE